MIIWRGAIIVMPINCKNRCNCIVSFDIILTTWPVEVLARPAADTVKALRYNRVETAVRTKTPQCAIMALCRVCKSETNKGINPNPTTSTHGGAIPWKGGIDAGSGLISREVCHSKYRTKSFRIKTGTKVNKAEII